MQLLTEKKGKKNLKRFYLDGDNFCQYLYVISSKIFASEAARLRLFQK